MNAKLQAGVELTLQKAAAEQAGVGLLSHEINAGLHKTALENQGVQQERQGTNYTPSSASGSGMEDKNKDYGKGSEYKLDDDPSKGQSSEQTGEVQTRTAGKNITTEGSGMPDLSIGQHSNKQASGRRSVLRTMLRGIGV